MRRRGQRLVITVLASCLILIWANRLGLLSPVKAVGGALFAPIGRLFSGAGSGVGTFFGNIANIRTLDDENARLSHEVADLRRRLSEDGELRLQNDALRKQLNFTGDKNQQLIPAQVVAYQPDNYRQFLVINRGSADGLKEGMAVVSEGFLVGKITEVNLKSAKVFLLIDPTFRVNGIDQETRASGTVRGQIGTGLVMDKIAQNETIKSGDTVITSGLGGDVPRGLVIGRVESVLARDNAVFQSATIASDLHFNKLELVFAVVGP